MRIISFLLLLAFASAAVFPCTIWDAHNGDAVLAGNNEDWTDHDTWIWFLPASQGRLGMVLTGFENAWAQGGMNEKGLFFDWFAGFGSKLAPVDPAKPEFTGNIGEEILARCETVDQALDLFTSYSNPAAGYAQILIADRFGASAAVRWSWSDGRYLIERSTAGWQAVGVGAQFIDSILSKDLTVTPERFTDLAASTIQPAYTVYSTVYDLKTGDIRLYYHQKYAAGKTWNIHTELARGARAYSMRALFPEEGRKTPRAPITTFFRPLALIIMAAGAAAFAAGLVFWIVSAIRRRIASSGSAGLSIAAASISILTCVAHPAILALIIAYTGFIYRYGFGIIHPALSALPVLIIILAGLQVLGTAAAWVKRLWGIRTRIFYTGLAALSIMVTGYVFAALNLLK